MIRTYYKVYWSGYIEAVRVSQSGFGGCPMPCKGRPGFKTQRLRKYGKYTTVSIPQYTCTLEMNPDKSEVAVLCLLGGISRHKTIISIVLQWGFG